MLTFRLNNELINIQQAICFAGKIIHKSFAASVENVTTMP